MNKQFIRSPIRLKLISASFINAGGFIFSSLVVLFWSYLLVKLYPANDSGGLLLCLSCAGMVNLLDFGTSIGITRIISSENSSLYSHHPRNYLLSAVIVSLLTEGMAVLLIIYFWKKLALPSLPYYGYFSLLILTLSSQVVLICVGFFKGLLNYRAANLVSAGTAIVVYGAGTVFLLAESSVWIVFFIMALMQVICAGASVIYVLGSYSLMEVSNKISFNQLVRVVYPNLFKTSIKLFPQMFAGIFFLHVQRLIIARYAGLELVAIFSLAYSIATRLHGVVNAFLEIIFPMAQRLRAQGINVLIFCLKLGGIFTVVYFLIASVVIAIVVTVLPHILKPLIAYSIGVMFAVAAIPSFHFLNGVGRAFQISFASLMSPIIYCILAFSIYSININYDNNLILPLVYIFTMFILFIWTFLLLYKYDHNKYI